jgi:hypothetical protein
LSVAAMAPRVFTVVGTIGMVMLVVAWLNSEHALYAANHAANYRANDRAHRASNAAAFVKSMRGAAGNALCLRG